MTTVNQTRQHPRRTIAQGAAWAVPAIALGVAAPAQAASTLAPIPCPTVPTGASWTITNGAASNLPPTSGTPSCDSGPTVWATATTTSGSRTGIRMYSDSQTQCTGAGGVLEKEVDASTTLVGLQAGCTYTLTFEIWVGPGYGQDTCTRHPSAMTINFNGTALKSYYTSSPTPVEFPPALVPPSGAELIPVQQVCPGGVGVPAFRDVVNYAHTFTASATTASLNLHFRMGPTNDSNNDDFLVIPRLTNCIC